MGYNLLRMTINKLSSTASTLLINLLDCFNVDILPIVIGITVGIILIGLLLLCVWKALQTARDKREYLLFLNESSKKKKWQVGLNHVILQLDFIEYN